MTDTTKETEKLTPWCSETVKPIHIGWYHTKGCQGYMQCAGYHYWNGEFWLIKPAGITTSRLPWRGLTEKHDE